MLHCARTVSDCQQDLRCKFLNNGREGQGIAADYPIRRSGAVVGSLLLRLEQCRRRHQLC